MARPLYIDLDGSLLQSDLAVEAIFSILKKKPWCLVSLFFLLLRRGRAALKSSLAANGTLEPTDLPFNQAVLQLITERRAEGGKTFLATASDVVLAERVAKHLGCFDGVLASDGRTNLKGEHKLKAILENQKTYGCGAFDYVGDSGADVSIWKAAHTAYGVNVRAALVKKMRQHGAQLVPLSADCTARRLPWLRLVRPHHWVKNLLLFVPLLLAHQWHDLTKLLTCFIGFCLFSAFASSIYVLNDLCDLESDRRHPTKSRRPLASGEISLLKAPLFALGLIVIPLVLSVWILPAWFAGALAFYLIVNLAYSTFLKRVVILDVVVLTLLYTLRIIAGGIVAEVLISPWLLTLSLFFFVSLALAKRYRELLALSDLPTQKPSGRGYQVEDLSLLGTAGVGSGLVTVLIVALYLNSEKVAVLYASPELLWLLCPLTIYWVLRVWLLTFRDKIHDDPIVFALRDPVSHLVAFLGLAVIMLAHTIHIM